MTGNCNHILREGSCDGVTWTECTYCGAIDNEPCKNVPIKIKSYDELTDRVLRDSLAKIKNRPLALHELQAVVIHILDRLDHIDN